jgi:preprotein translocase subunit SecE
VSEAVDTLDNKGKDGKESVGEFIRHTREELDKTHFLHQMTLKYDDIVIVNVIFFAIYLFLIDRAWVYIIEGMTWLVNKIVGI